MVYFDIHCPTCGAEQAAVKVHGHIKGRVGWWNECQRCGRCFPALPPSFATRQKRRQYEKRSGQLLLGGGW